MSKKVIDWVDKEYPELSFRLLYIPTREKRNIIMETQRQQGLRKKQGAASLFDIEKSNQLTLLRVIDGWEGLKNKHLKFILDQDKVIEGKCGYKGKPDKDGRFDPEFEIKFSQDVLREIAENHSFGFMEHINNGINFVDEKVQNEAFDQLKN